MADFGNLSAHMGTAYKESELCTPAQEHYSMRRVGKT